jgi:hypothetical protein
MLDQLLESDNPISPWLSASQPCCPQPERIFTGIALLRRNESISCGRPAIDSIRRRQGWHAPSIPPPVRSGPALRHRAFCYVAWLRISAMVH